MLWVFARHAGVSVLEVLGQRFDAVGYTQIAEHGYDFTLHTKPDGTLTTTNLTFFPLFPALVALVKTITFLPTPVAGILVAWAAGLAAAWGVFALGNHLFDRRTGVMLVALWAALPAAVVESMAYTETLFTAIVAWTLLAVLKRRWLPAAALAVLGGLSRPSATALVAAVCLASLVAIVQRRDGWRPWAALLAAPLGYAGYIAWVSMVVGRVDGYFYIQQHAWNISFDGGQDTARRFVRLLTESMPLTYYVSAFTILTAVLLLVLTLMDRQPWPLWVFSLTLIVLTLGTSQYFWAKGRYLIPAVTLLLPIAVSLARTKARTMIVVLGFLTLASASYGTYLTLVWKYSP
ncbi:membrane protein [Catellatospora methionotrophica]|uniref:Membrane protein n=1 Tax=Catellatospora methionotrophica TaxID=121620 RepID=A0A8J3PGR2_9ACTN|nr:membrane protein [Catellatospora methionotrophica]